MPNRSISAIPSAAASTRADTRPASRRGGDGTWSSVSACRACGAGALTTVLPLGRMPLANALPRPEDPAEAEARYPLTLAVCEQCALVQILESVSPEHLFRDYIYFSSFSDSLVAHARESARRLIQTRRLGASNLVLEIASNDGYMLKNFVDAGIPVLGIEPARNIAAVAEKAGVRTLAEFFGEQMANDLAAQGVRADVVLANNVMAHVPDVNGILQGISKILRDDGIFVMESPYVLDLIEHLEFDTIYHEHLFYYSLTSLDRLFVRNGLKAVDVERIPTHGGSLRVTAMRADRAVEMHTVRDLKEEEQERGVSDLDTYRAFATQVTGLRDELVGMLRSLKQQGCRIAAYGAAAKGATLLNFFGIGRETLEFVVDRSTYKQGRLMPGVRLPIHAPAHLLEEMPDHVLLLSWNMADEILKQQKEYRRRAGQFIIPLPFPRIV